MLADIGADTRPQPLPARGRGEYVEAQKRAGKLVATGGLKSREKDGLRVRRKDGAISVADGCAAWAGATGWAILQAETREALIADVTEFLGEAGDGVSEVIEISWAELD